MTSQINKIREWRKANKMTAQQMAKIVGCSQPQWTRIENGDSQPNTEQTRELILLTGLPAKDIRADIGLIVEAEKAVTKTENTEPAE